MEEVKKPHKASKKDRADILLKKIKEWQAEGLKGDDLLEKLSPAQYDFLLDYGINLDHIIYTDEQLKITNEIKRSKRSLSPNGYNKKYPQAKQDLYNGLEQYLISLGAETQRPQKENYRDLSFKLQDTQYKIVLSNPRQ